MFYVIGISAIFEDIDLKSSTHINETLPSNILYVFCENFGFEGKGFERKKWIFFLSLKILKIRGRSFVAILILRHVISVNCS